MKNIALLRKAIASLGYMTLLIGYSGCTISSSGTHGNIKKYEFNYSKQDVSKAIEILYKEYNQYKVPHEYDEYTWHYGGDSTTKDQWIREANADTVSFSFFLKDSNYIVWSSFVGYSDDWKKATCELSLIGYLDVKQGKWKFERDLNKEEQKKIKTMFEGHILNEIKEILNNKP